MADAEANMYGKELNYYSWVVYSRDLPRGEWADQSEAWVKHKVENE